MNKELTPLEAFRKIIDMAHEPNGYQNFTNACDTPYTTVVETALKDYEKKTKLAKEYKDVNKVAKRLKALEIIKKIVKYDIEVNGNKDIPKYEPNGVITKEEYDLLKEVLL